MRQSPPPPSAQSTSPRPKESSFLKSIGKELSSFGGGLLGTPSKTTSKAAPPPAKAPAPDVRRASHRPAPKTPVLEAREGSFPGVKLRSRETLLPQETSNTDLTEQDFDDLAGASDAMRVLLF
jgi:hypothetical protein